MPEFKCYFKDLFSVRIYMQNQKKSIEFPVDVKGRLNDLNIKSFMNKFFPMWIKDASMEQFIRTKLTEECRRAYMNRVYA